MNSSRFFSLYDLLKREFKNPAIKSLACDSAKEILTHYPELATRIFDKFPCLITKNELTALTGEFHNFFEKIDNTSIIETEQSVDLIHESDKADIAEWEQKIAKMAISQLLNEKGHIKDEIIELLQWQNFQKELKSPALTCSIVCAYVGAVNQVIIQKLANQLIARNTIFVAVCKYINNHHRSWVNYEIYQAKQRWSLTEEKYDKITHQNTLNWSSKIAKPEAGVFVVLGAVAAAAAFLFFKKNTDVIPSPVEEKNLNNFSR